MTLRFIFSLLIASSSLSLFAAGGQPLLPVWPATVRIYNTGMGSAAIQADADNAAGLALANNRGYALLFQPGVYNNLLLNMRQFGSVMGLGVSRTFTTINDVRAVQSSEDPCVGALNDHWKSAENFQTTPTNVVPNGGLSKGMAWTGSQGCPLRNILIKDSSLYLSQLINIGGTFFTGASTGAFVANCTIVPLLSMPKQENLIFAGSQQQLLFRNVSLGNGATNFWNGGKWNQVLVGCDQDKLVNRCGNCAMPMPSETNPVGCQCANSLCSSTNLDGNVCNPAVTDSCQQIVNTNPCNAPAFTIVSRTPKIAEKPYIFYNASGPSYNLVIPQEELDKFGATSPGSPPPVIVPFTNVYVARPDVDNAFTINEQLNFGNHVVLTPGVYFISQPIVITQPNTVLLGIGFPMILGPMNQPKIIVENVDGVRIAGILMINNPKFGTPTDPLDPDPFFFNRSPVDSSVYLQWGRRDSPEAAAAAANVKSGYLYDFFGRLDPKLEASSFWGNKRRDVTNTMVEINSANIVCDNVWLWRNPTLFNFFNRDGSYRQTYNLTGAKIYGNNAIAYGMICDYAYGDQLQWYGNNGQSYAYQGTFPFDIIDSEALSPTGIYQFCGYHVNDDAGAGPVVTNHKAYGVSVYSNFLTQTFPPSAGTLFPDNGITTGAGSGIQFVNASTRFLDGSLGGINYVINGEGFNTDGKNADPFPSVCERAPGPSIVCNSDGTPVNTALQKGPKGACGP